MPHPSDKISDNKDTPYRKVFIIWVICFVVFLIFLWQGPGLLRSITWTQPQNSLILGEKYLKEGKLEPAYEKLKEAVKLFPTDAHAHYLLAYTSMKLKHPEQAVNEYQTSLELDGKNPPADSELEQLYSQLGKTAEAQSLSDKIAVQNAQKDLDNKEFQKSVDTLSKIPAGSAYYPQARTLLAVSLSQTGKLDAAIKELQKVISLDSTQQGALQTLYDLYQKKGMTTPAQELKIKLNELSPKISVQQNLANRVIFLGYDISTNTVAAGKSFEITYYWKCLVPFKEKYTVGVQFYDSKGDIPITNWHDPVNGTYPTTQWKPGDVIKEKYTVAVPNNAPADSYFIKVQMCLPDGTKVIGNQKFPIGQLKVIS